MLNLFNSQQAHLFLVFCLRLYAFGISCAYQVKSIKSVISTGEETY